MDFKFTKEQQRFREKVREFTKTEIAPIVDEYERIETFPMEILPKAAEQGFLAIGLPEELGGTGDDLLYMSIFVEEMARECAGIALSLYPCASMAWGLYKSGSEEQKEKFMMPLIRGEALCSLALSEPNAGSDVMSIEATATADGDSYILNGSKAFVTNGTNASFIIVVTKTVKEDGSQGMSAFIVETDTKGVIVENKLSKMGLRSSETSGLVFEDCRIPASSQWGGKESGFVGMMTGLDRSRLSIASLSIGIAEAAFFAAFARARERKAFEKSIGTFQSTQFTLVDMLLRIENAKNITYKAIEMTNAGEPSTKEASMAKLYASESAVKIARETLRIFGDNGYDGEYPVERYFRDSKVLTIFEGTSEIQNIIISREMGL